MNLRTGPVGLLIALLLAVVSLAPSPVSVLAQERPQPEAPKRTEPQNVEEDEEPAQPEDVADAPDEDAGEDAGDPEAAGEDVVGEGEDPDDVEVEGDGGGEAAVEVEGEAPPAAEAAAPLEEAADTRAANGRRVPPGGLIKFGYKDEPVDEPIFSFIAEATGKVVMPVSVGTLKTKKITLITDALLPRHRALDMLFQAMRLNDVGVIEKEEVIIIGQLSEIVRLRVLPVVTADMDIMKRTDKGTLIVKLFQLSRVPAEDLFDHLSETLPQEVSNLSVDVNSNQLILAADVGLCQHVQTIIDQLDNQYVEAETRTFRLAHADATGVSENILDLFDNAGTAGAQQRQPRQPTRGVGGRGAAQAARPGATAIGPEIQLRVTVNQPRNTVTVVAEPTVIEEIQRLIDEVWDLPRSPGTAKIYNLYYTDPIKVSDVLNSLLGEGGTGPRPATGGRGGAGQGGDVSQALAGIYNIEPYPDANQLLVFCKTVEAVDFLDDFIANIDQPTDIGLPFVMELKHANAVELADELNVLLAPGGRGGELERPETGLGGREEGGVAVSGQDTGTAGTIDFPWTRGGGQDDQQTAETSLIGRVRVVPVVRQNALAILCPAPQRQAMRELVGFFDRPGRQVMISAVVAAVDLTDELNLGLRFSSGQIATANDDYLFQGNTDFSGTIDNPLSGIFDMSVLDVGLNVNVALQLLQQKTRVRIIQQPVIFTGDNQEAIFFDGQDIPFISNTVINAQGNPTDSFEYKEVGITLNVRPRITVNREIDLDVLLVLSNVVPGQTLFGGAIIDRRETRTHVVVRDQETVVISGILLENETKITRQVPLLGDVPLLGELFKSRENTTQTQELIAFVTPHVIDNPMTDRVQQGYRDRLEEINRPLKAQWDEWRDDPARIRDRVLPGIQSGEMTVEEYEAKQAAEAAENAESEK